MLQSLSTGQALVDRIVEREIFGPILPVIEVENEDEAIEFINGRYVCFTGSSEIIFNKT